MSEQPARTVIGVQYLRFFAALAVVIHHAFSTGLWPQIASISCGEAGVDVFFVISGFIMFTVGRTEAPLAFMARRAIRIVPMYWFATLVAAALIMRKIPILTDIVDLAKSLLFIPFVRPITLDIRPLLIPGWTLNYEVFFYALFAIGLLCRSLAVTVGLIFAFVVAGLVFHPTFTVGAFYTDSIILEFLAGMAIGWAYEKFCAAPWFAFLTILIPLSLTWIAIVPHGPPRILRFGIPAVLLVASVLAAEPWLRIKRSKTLLLLGGASYAIYLVHTLLMGGSAAFKALHFTTWSFWLFMLIFTVASVGLGVLAHLFAERPATKWLRSVSST